MDITTNCLALVKYFEGCELTAYTCPAGILTIGYGHTGRDVKPGMCISQARADELLRSDLATCIAAVNRMVKVPLTHGQFDALVSFGYNLGLEALRNSTLMKLVNAGRMDAAAGEFGKWVHSKGKVLDGLVKRRKAEANLFRTSVFRVAA